MKIRRVAIRHFRSIKELVFYPGNICALVGENNAGKTNILKALNFLLGETWPSRNHVDISYYYNQDTSEPIYIQVDFDENPVGIERIWCSIPWEGPAETKLRYTGNDTVYNLTSRLREQCAIVYLGADRNLEHHLGSSRWALFGRIIRLLNEDFSATVGDPGRRALEERFAEAQQLLETDLYREFEDAITAAFDDQLKKTTHSISLEFKALDPLNYYKCIQPVLTEGEQLRHPSESGQGMRNLVLLALFRAYAKVFKSNAIIAVEEPELYMHPHAQRSLSSLFRTMANNGCQVFLTTHSSSFLSVEHFDEICVVGRSEDLQGATTVRQVSRDRLVNLRKALVPDKPVSAASVRARYRAICNLEHNEAFFARKIVLVEGETEQSCLPIYAQALGYDFDSAGISVVNVHGKNNLAAFYQLYTAFKKATYIIFDNDRGGRPPDLKTNELLLRLLRQPEVSEPDGVVTGTYTILEGTFEAQMRSSLEGDKPGLYDDLVNKASTSLGPKAGKGVVARYMATQLVAQDYVPNFIRSIIDAVIALES